MTNENEKALPATETPSSNTNDNQNKSMTQEELWEKCEKLAMNLDLKTEIRWRIMQRGYAGSPVPVEANILMITSRLLPRPMNGANISQSSSGKTKALDTALAFFPKTAYYKVDAGSEKILIYNEESFEHKTVIFSEADSLPEEGPGAAALRAIISDNKMSYEYVAKAKGKVEKFITKRIEKQGPTNCITTSTKRLSKQLGTRMLCLTIDDSAEQTRQVMRAIAERVNNPDIKHFAEDDFIALQLYIEKFGKKQVFIPIADELAEYIPPDQVRMRRDFEQFLTAIQASALLHQFKRETDKQGRIIATCQDYKYAAEVFGELFEELATESVTSHVRETVIAVQNICEQQGKSFATTNDIIEVLQVRSRNTINNRVKQALSAEFLINQNDGKGKQPYHLVLGVPLPEKQNVIPQVEEIESCKGVGNCLYHHIYDRTAVQASSTDSVLLSSENEENNELSSEVEQPNQNIVNHFKKFPMYDKPHQCDLQDSMFGLRCKLCGVFAPK